MTARAAFGFILVIGLAGLAAPALADDAACRKAAAAACGANPFSQCFTDSGIVDGLGAACEDTVNALLDEEQEAKAASERAKVSAEGRSGLSYGGILREGPSMDSAKKASMKKGDSFEILEDTGIWMNDYKWFKIRSARGTGYHWGGIFCVKGDAPYEGVFDNCQYMSVQ